MAGAPPGRLVDIGGFRLHLQLVGEGSPIVVFDAALGGSSVSWARVLPEVGTCTRACSYDRAGFGWSDAGPKPRTAERLVGELRALLRAAGLPPPYVLVGHSFGAFVVELFAARHREEVSGLVLVEPPDLAEWAPPSDADRRRLEIGAWLCRRGALAARLGLATLVLWLARAGALRMARLVVGAVSGWRLHGHEPELLAPVRGVPPALRPTLYRMWTRPTFFEALASQIEHVPTTAAQVLAATAGGFGELPLLVLSAASAGPDRLRRHAAVARLSARGRQIVVERTGHWIPLDRPDAVVAAICDLVREVRSSAIAPRSARD